MEENKQIEEILKVILENQDELKSKMDIIEENVIHIKDYNIVDEKQEKEQIEQIQQVNENMQQQNTKMEQNKKYLNYVIAGILIIIILKMVAG